MTSCLLSGGRHKHFSNSRPPHRWLPFHRTIPLREPYRRSNPPHVAYRLQRRNCLGKRRHRRQEARKRGHQRPNCRKHDRHLEGTEEQDTDGVNGPCLVDARLQQEKISLENAKTEARESFDLHTQQVIALYGESINRYLERINAGFESLRPRIITGVEPRAPATRSLSISTRLTWGL